jgi:hypothetical protein
MCNFKNKDKLETKMGDLWVANSQTLHACNSSALKHDNPFGMIRLVQAYTTYFKVANDFLLPTRTTKRADKF